MIALMLVTLCFIGVACLNRQLMKVKSKKGPISRALFLYLVGIVYRGISFV